MEYLYKGLMMADGNISQIQLPDGKKYNIKDATIIIDSEYNATDYEVTLIIGSSNSSNNTGQ